MLGEVVTYTVTATNQGAVDATGVQVTDVLPAGIPSWRPCRRRARVPSNGDLDVGTLAHGALVTSCSRAA